MCVAAVRAVNVVIAAFLARTLLRRHKEDDDDAEEVRVRNNAPQSVSYMGWAK